MNGICKLVDVVAFTMTKGLALGLSFATLRKVFIKRLGALISFYSIALTQYEATTVDL